ncbi:hypothetical protein ACFY93_15720 [Streptomyces sp. NPDC008313]|uniref:hypothetical protein n=1 Tax=Streptomyces sp. NPDC008313 TaxID=3364826 RepID=UPI0036E2AF04
MDPVDRALTDAMTIRGALGAAVVDYLSRVTLGARGGLPGLDLQKAGEADTDVVRAKLHALSVLGYPAESLEDILVTLTDEYHLIRPVTRRKLQGIYLYLVLDRHRAPLAVARARLREIESRLDM